MDSCSENCWKMSDEEAASCAKMNQWGTASSCHSTQQQQQQQLFKLEGSPNTSAPPSEAGGGGGASVSSGSTISGVAPHINYCWHCTESGPCSKDVTDNDVLRAAYTRLVDHPEMRRRFTKEKAPADLPPKENNNSSNNNNAAAAMNASTSSNANSNSNSTTPNTSPKEGYLVPQDALVQVNAPNNRRPYKLVPWSLMLYTAGSKKALDFYRKSTRRDEVKVMPLCDSMMDPAAKADLETMEGALTGSKGFSACAHYYFNGQCRRGNQCGYIHLITVDTSAVAGQMAKKPNYVASCEQQKKTGCASGRPGVGGSSCSGAAPSPSAGGCSMTVTACSSTGSPPPCVGDKGAPPFVGSSSCGGWNGQQQPQHCAMPVQPCVSWHPCQVLMQPVPLAHNSCSHGYQPNQFPWQQLSFPNPCHQPQQQPPQPPHCGGGGQQFHLVHPQQQQGACGLPPGYAQPPGAMMPPPPPPTGCSSQPQTEAPQSQVQEQKTDEAAP